MTRSLNGAGAMAKLSGVIDIGSNSVRLVIFADGSRSPEQLFNEKVVCGLGNGMAHTGLLSEEGIELTLETLHRFRVVADHYGVTRMDVMATAAARDAANGPAFIKNAEAAIGTGIQVLTGLEEACIAAEGVLSGMPEAEGLVGDMGGGSLELAHLRQGRIINSVSLPVGALRLADRYGRDGAAIRAGVREALDRVAWIDDAKGETIYAVGGIWRNVARVHMTDTDYPLQVLHAYCMPSDQVSRLGLAISGEKGVPPQALEILPRKRLDYIVHGASALQALVERCRSPHVTISAYGLREGKAFSRLSHGARAEDPLFAAATQIAERTARAVIDRGQLDLWLGSLFDVAGAQDGQGTAYWARLRHAAGLLADIGWRFNPDSRAHDSARLVLTAALPGIDHMGRAYVALALWNRYTGVDPEGLMARGATHLLDPDMQAEARRLGRCLRLAFTLTGGAPGLLRHCRLSQPSANVLLLTLSGPACALDGGETRKRLDRLADAFGCTGQIECT